MLVSTGRPCPSGDLEGTGQLVLLQLDPWRTIPPILAHLSELLSSGFCLHMHLFNLQHRLFCVPLSAGWVINFSYNQDEAQQIRCQNTISSKIKTA